MPLMNSASRMGKDFRSFVSGRFVLELGDGGKGKAVGMVVSIDGGHLKSEAIGEKVGAEGLETRYPGRQKFEDITIQVGTSMSPEFWEWVSKSIANQYTRKSGSIVAYDFDGKERSRRNFYDALIAEVQFPALDAKAKAPAYITVKIAPETMDWAKAGGQPGSPVDLTKQKLWIPANFRFRIDGFNGETMKWVQKVDALSVKQNIILNPVGKELYVRKEVGRIEFPNINFSLPENYVDEFYAWWKRFVGDGNHVSSDEHTGMIEYLSSDLRETLMTISFQGIGITGITLDKHEAQTEQIRMAKIECYCESMSLTPGKGTT